MNCIHMIKLESIYQIQHLISSVPENTSERFEL